MIESNPIPIWEHYNPVYIVSGVDSFKCLNGLVTHDKILFITTSGFTNRGLTEKIVETFGSERVTVYDKINAYPELDELDAIIDLFFRSDINGILALGGGSVIDTAKVLGVGLVSKIERPLNHLFRLKKPFPFVHKLPIFVIPTTSGTGAEATPFATVWDHKTSSKYSLSDKQLYPDYALLDPMLTLSLPRKETLYTGLDAISHAMESLWNKNRTPITQSLAIQSIELAIEALPIVLKDSLNLHARNKMQISSLLAGIAISQTKTAIAHSISYPLTLQYGVPHGLACSFTLTAIAKQFIKENYLKNKQIFHSLIDLLTNLHLQEEILKYIQPDEMIDLISKMMTPERSGNFYRKIDEDEIKMILQGSVK